MLISEESSIMNTNENISEISTADISTQNTITINEDGIHAEGVEGIIVATGAAVAMCIATYNLTKD